MRLTNDFVESLISPPNNSIIRRGDPTFFVRAHAMAGLRRHLPARFRYVPEIHRLGDHVNVAGAEEFYPVLIGTLLSVYVPTPLKDVIECEDLSVDVGRMLANRLKRLHPDEWSQIVGQIVEVEEVLHPTTSAVSTVFHLAYGIARDPAAPPTTE